MKKLGKKLNKFMKLFLVFSMLFNNLSSLSVVFADEITNDETVVGDTLDNTDDTVNDEGNDKENNDSLEDETNDNTEVKTEEDDTTEVIFSVDLNDDDKLVIKYNKTSELSEEDKLTIAESFKYADETVTKFDTVVELTEEVKTALESEEGYVFNTQILSGNVYEGEYTVNVTIGGEEKVINKAIEANGEGFEFKLYDSEGNEIIPEEGLYYVDSSYNPIDEVYYIDEDASSFTVTAKLLNGGISPDDVISDGEDEVMAYELFLEGTVTEETLEGYLHGQFDYNLSFDYTINGEEKTIDKTFTIMYGGYQTNTGDLNESAKNVGLDDQYVFFGIYDTPDNAVYTISEEGIEDILKDFVGEDGIITYEVSDEDGLLITLTDGRVTITYAEAEADEGSLTSRLESDSDNVSSGDTFTVKYIVTIDDYYINGFSGLVKYDEDLLKLTNISSEISEFNGNNKDGQFLYAGYKMLKPEITVNETGDDATIEPKEYTILTLTFEALKAGEASIGIDDARFYEMNSYYGSEEELSTSVIINESTDNSLSSLTVAGQSIELSEDQLEYEITVSNDVTKADVEAIVANETAEITSIVAPEELAEGENIITIVVTAENGDEKVYTVKVTREAAKKEESTPVASQMSYQEDTTDDNNDDTVATITTGPIDDNKIVDDEEETKDGVNVSRIIIIILILLALAGLIYLIFKDDDDDEETKKANKEIDKLRKEDNNKSKKIDNDKKVKKKER